MMTRRRPGDLQIGTPRTARAQPSVVRAGGRYVQLQCTFEFSVPTIMVTASAVGDDGDGHVDVVTGGGYETSTGSVSPGPNPRHSNGFVCSQGEDRVSILGNQLVYPKVYTAYTRLLSSLSILREPLILSRFPDQLLV